jgi:hypothetical protein
VRKRIKSKETFLGGRTQRKNDKEGLKRLKKYAKMSGENLRLR